MTDDHHHDVEGLVDVGVCGVQTLSPTVKGFTLRATRKCTFKPGQWVDLHVPNVEEVTGYSITSHPALLNKDGIITLAVQRTTHPVTAWMHSQCRVGDQLKVKVGGQFCCEHTLPANTGLLMAAGGIGINPLYSMIQHYIRTTPTPSIHLLYSARSDDELLFKEKLNALTSSKVQVTYFVTRQSATPTSGDMLTRRRITAADIATALLQLKETNANVQCYLCGPPTFISSTVDVLREHSVPRDSIHYEQWW